MPPPPAPPPDAADRKDRKAEALSLEHKMCHLPFNPWCKVCRIAKASRKHHRKAKEDKLPKAVKFGDVLTADHIITRRKVSEAYDGS